MYDISRLLRDNPYPGRGIVLGRSGDDRCSVLAYFIMGRSANSRNRVFDAIPGGIRIAAAPAACPLVSGQPPVPDKPAPYGHLHTISMSERVIIIRKLFMGEEGGSLQKFAIFA